jgi:hypothetical protein
MFVDRPNTSARERDTRAEHLLHGTPHSGARCVVVTAQDSMTSNLRQPGFEIFPYGFVSMISVQEEQIDRPIRKMVERVSGILSQNFDRPCMPQQTEILAKNP